MTSYARHQNLQLAETGRKMYALIEELYPICRSITGEGVRKSLKILQRHVPLEIREVPTGTQVFDWTVPKEWNIRDAYIKDESGTRVVDFGESNLHVVSYSVPIHETMSLDELRPHLHTLPDHPEWIPYRTSYYRETWGFCLSQNVLDGMHDGQYEVCIDSTLAPGSLTYGEYVLPGEVEDEILISCHICHPSLCNDNLSGVALATFLAKRLTSTKRRYSYRFLFLPGTIGAIAWLSGNEPGTQRIKHGLVVACVGDNGHMSYKRSRRGDAEIDQVVTFVLEASGKQFDVHDFSPYGYDERQYCSPGFNLAVGSLSRTPYGCFAEYHTSADNLDFVHRESLADSLQVYLEVCEVLDTNRRYRSNNPKCEPQLGKRGLYGSLGGASDAKQKEMAMLWVLNFSDGEHSLLDIAARSSVSYANVLEAATVLTEHGLLEEVFV